LEVRSAFVTGQRGISKLSGFVNAHSDWSEDEVAREVTRIFANAKS